jgi:putative hydrolase of the HAD superfamily
MQKRYKHIFFDLDRTLWDFDASAEEAFSKIYEKFDLKSRGVESVEKFKQYYTLHNEFLWSLYREGRLQKEVLRSLRFRKTLEDFGIKDEKLAEDIGNYYVEISPLLVHLFPNAIETLEYLHPKYELHIITNGFSEVQFAKLKVSGMKKYFRRLSLRKKPV